MTTCLRSIIVSSLICFSCANRGFDHSVGSGFAIYLLADTTITAAAAQTQPLESLSLSQIPLISERDVEGYYWATHTLVPNANLRARLRQLGTKPYMSEGAPFVLIVGPNRIYLGTLWWTYSNSTPRIPYIMLYPFDRFEIQPPLLPRRPDMRSDDRIHEALRNANILRD